MSRNKPSEVDEGGHSGQRIQQGQRPGKAREDLTCLRD